MLAGGARSEQGGRREPTERARLNHSDRSGRTRCRLAERRWLPRAGSAARAALNAASGHASKERVHWEDVARGEQFSCAAAFEQVRAWEGVIESGAARPRATGDCPKWKRSLERVGMRQLHLPHDASPGLDVRSEAGTSCFN